MRQRITQWCLALMLSLCAAVATAATAPVASKDYVVLERPQPTVNADGVEVREFFSYGCPHCATFEPRFKQWLKQAPEGVTLVQVPVVFHQSWAPLAKAFYAAQSLGELDRLHRKLFDAVHVDGLRLRTDANVVEFFVSQGIPKDKAEAAMASFHVDTNMRQGPRMLRDYRIESTPSVVVNGKYVVSPSGAGGQERMIEVIDALVRQELAAKKQAK